MKSLKFIPLLIFVILSLSCEDDPTQVQSDSIIGRIIDKASGKPLSTTSLILENQNNSYISTTNIDGYFEFRDLINGEYTLTSKKNIESAITKSANFNGEIIDTLGTFSTNNTNWGELYSKTFCSITGTIAIPEETDYSEITVKLLGTDKIALTTNKGQFRFDFLFPGVYDIVIEKESFKKSSIKDIALNKGDVFTLDTIVNPIHNKIKIEHDALNWQHRKIVDFAFIEDQFWYCVNTEPLISYDPQTNSETPYLWEGLNTMTHPYSLGASVIADTYDNSFWIAGDAASNHYIREISINNNQVTVSDSISNSSVGIYFNIAWDTKTKKLFGPLGYNKELKIFDPENREISKKYVEITLNYEDEIYKGNGGTIVNAIGTPEDKIYLFILKETTYDKKVLFLYEYDNLDSMNLIQSYIFPDSYIKHYYPVFYRGYIYVQGDKIVLK